MVKLETSRYRRIFTAVWSGGAARLANTAATLIALPLAVRYLGPERYGIWATVATTAAWINLLDLGVANTLTNHISRAFALDDRDAAARYLTNALALTAGIAAAAGVLFAALSARINWMRLFNIGPAVNPVEVQRTVIVAIAVMLLGLIGNVTNRLLAGYQELHRGNFAACAGVIASIAGLGLGVLLHVSMPVLFVMSAGCLPLASLAMLTATVVWLKPWLRPRVSLFNRSTIRELLSSGVSFFLIQVAAVVVFSSDNIIVSHYLGAAEVTPYSVTWRFIGLAAVLQSVIFPALWPAYAEAHAKGDFAWIRRTFAATMKGTLLLNLACVVALVIFGRSLIRLWAGSSAVPSLDLLFAMGVWAVISGFMNVESCLLAALNRVRAQALLSVIAAAVNIVLSLLLVRHIGALGVIAGTILSYVIVLVVPQSLIVRNLLRRELAEKMVAPRIPAALFARAGK